MKQNHTPEPWNADSSGHIGSLQMGYIPILTPFTEDAHRDKFGGPTPEAIANARRIVSCVNALAGYNPNAIGPFIEAIKKVIWDSDYLAGRQYVGGMKREQAEKNVLTSLAALRSAFAAFKQEESQ